MNAADSMATAIPPSSATDREIAAIVDGVLLLLSWQKFMADLRERRKHERRIRKVTA